MSKTQKPLAKSSAKKILITGAFATGKSTLVRAVVEQLDSLQIPFRKIGEVPRRCPYALNQDQTPLASLWLLSEQIRSEVEALIGELSLVICDRGVPDILSHTTVLANLTQEQEAARDIVVRMTELWSQTYDIVFLARLDLKAKIPNDGIRVPDKAYQIQMEQSLLKVLSDLQIEFVELPSDNKGRLELVLAAIAPFFAKK